MFALACGDSSETDLSPPTLSLSNITVSEGQSVTVTPEATGDNLVYAWTLDSNIISVDGQSNPSLSFDAPFIDEDTSILVSLTITDANGLTATKSALVAIKQTEQQFTISGSYDHFHYDPADVPAVIMLNIGDEEVHRVTTDGSQLTYTLTTTVSAEQAQALVTVRVTPAETDSFGFNGAAEYITFIGSVNDVVEQAGEDTVLTRDESEHVYVSAISTARAIATDYYLESMDSPIADVVDDAIDKSSLGEIHELAYQVYQFNNTPTAVLLNNSNKLNFINNFSSGWINNSTVDNWALSTLQEDENVRKQINSALPSHGFDEVKTIDALDIRTIELITSTRGTFNDEFFTYTVNSVGDLVAEFDGYYQITNALVNDDLSMFSYYESTIRYEKLLRGFTLRITKEVFDSQEQNFVSGRFLIHKLIPMDDQFLLYQFPEFFRDDTYSFASYAHINRENIPFEIIPGTSMLLPTPGFSMATETGRELKFDHVDVEFNADGTGTFRADDSMFTWTLTSPTVLAIHLDATSNVGNNISNGYSVSYNFLGGDLFRVLLPNDRIIKQGLRYDSTTEIAFTAGVYSSDGNTNINSTLEYSYHIFHDNGNYDFVIARDENADGVISVDEVSVDFGRWENDNGVIEFNSVWNSLYQSSPFHRIEDGEWTVRSTYTADLKAVNDDKARFEIFRNNHSVFSDTRTYDLYQLELKDGVAPELQAALEQKMATYNIGN